MKPAWACKGSE